jgi:hypothetical protein
MSASIYGNVGGVSRKAKELYGDVGGVTRKLKSASANVDGVTRKIFSGAIGRAYITKSTNLTFGYISGDGSVEFQANDNKGDIHSLDIHIELYTPKSIYKEEALRIKNLFCSSSREGCILVFSCDQGIVAEGTVGSNTTSIHWYPKNDYSNVVDYCIGIDTSDEGCHLSWDGNWEAGGFWVRDLDIN